MPRGRPRIFTREEELEIVAALRSTYGGNPLDRSYFKSFMAERAQAKGLKAPNDKYLRRFIQEYKELSLKDSPFARKEASAQKQVNQPVSAPPPNSMNLLVAGNIKKLLEIRDGMKRQGLPDEQIEKRLKVILSSMAGDGDKPETASSTPSKSRSIKTEEPKKRGRPPKKATPVTKKGAGGSAKKRKEEEEEDTDTEASSSEVEYDDDSEEPEEDDDSDSDFE